jgi:hypothetical protein
MEKDPATGLYTVTCTDGTKETKVTQAQIQSGKVCGRLTPVNPKAFNAFLLWRDGEGTPILDYPTGYDVLEGKIDPDGVFYVDPKMYWFNGNMFIKSVTEGAKVEGDLLTYPTKEGRTLALKFSASAEKLMHHEDAAQYCKAAGLRLPHIQEIFDFCAAGTEKSEEGLYADNFCAGRLFWSASVSSYDRLYAWLFSGEYGSVDSYNRYARSGVVNGVRCVGSP